jgi:hypothetical protein
MVRPFLTFFGLLALGIPVLEPIGRSGCAGISVSTAEAREARAGPDRITLEAIVAAIPRTERCLDRKIYRATALYRVERVLEGTYRDKTVLVLHRCPEIPRGPSRYGRGEAGAIKPGRIHRLTLERLPDDKLKQVRNLTDPFVDDRRPRYKALRTDRGVKPPRFVVVVSGGVGTNLKLVFDARSVTVGRGGGNDVRLGDPAVSRRHLLLEVRGDKAQVRDLGSRSGTRINDKLVTKPQKITYRDRIQVGPYSLKVSLFMSAEEPE